jgi:chemotaxis protein methyltransferase CheR
LTGLATGAPVASATAARSVSSWDPCTKVFCARVAGSVHSCTGDHRRCRREPQLNTLTAGQIPISDHEFAAFRNLFQELAGIHLSDAKKQLVYGRLRGRVRELGLAGFDDYFQLVNRPGQSDERQRVVDLLTTNETYFFREPRHFDVLRNEVLPERSKARPFRVWSAACSTGEEPYSLAMVLADTLGASRFPGWEVMGSDISQRVLDRARTGLYPLQRIEGIPRPLLQAYCVKGGGPREGTLQIDKALRNQVSFRRINLNDRLPEIGQFDLVLLRNMLIYFQNDAKIEIVRRIISVMVPGAWLMVGHSESLKNIDPRLIPHSPSIYRFAP